MVLSLLTIFKLTLFELISLYTHYFNYIIIVKFLFNYLLSQLYLYLSLYNILYPNLYYSTYILVFLLLISFMRIFE